MQLYDELDDTEHQLWDARQERSRPEVGDRVVICLNTRWNTLAPEWHGRIVTIVGIAPHRLTVAYTTDRTLWIHPEECYPL